MFGFFLKKNICDVWDNLFYTLISNLFSMLAYFIFYLLIFLSFSSFISPSLSPVCIAFSVIIGFSIISTIFFASGKSAKKIAGFSVPNLKAFIFSIPSSFLDGGVFGFLFALFLLIVSVSLPFYFKLWISCHNILFLLLSLLIFWITLTVMFSLQWFLPIRSLMGDSFKKCLRKSFIIFFDNMGFSFALLAVNFVNLFFSVITLGLFPGMTGICITSANALRLLMYKYDWLEVNPDLSFKEKRCVPWKELLEKDRKTLGPRTIKGFFFPWKEK